MLDWLELTDWPKEVKENCYKVGTFLFGSGPDSKVRLSLGNFKWVAKQSSEESISFSPYGRVKSISGVADDHKPTIDTNRSNLVFESLLL